MRVRRRRNHAEFFDKSIFLFSVKIFSDIVFCYIFMLNSCVTINHAQVIDLFFSPPYLQTIQTNCPWLLRYAKYYIRKYFYRKYKNTFIKTFSMNCPWLLRYVYVRLEGGGGGASRGRGGRLGGGGGGGARGGGD